STTGQPHFLGRRMRHHEAEWTTRVAFEPERDGDLAGLMAFMDEEHFLVAGIERGPEGSRLVVRRKDGAAGGPNGAVVAEAPLPAGTDKVELRLAIDEGAAKLDWRPAGLGVWR